MRWSTFQQTRWVQVLSVRNGILFAAAAFVVVLAIVPLYFLVLNSFKELSLARFADFGLGNLSLANFSAVYSDVRTFTYLGNTVQYAAGSMAVAMFFGFSIAFLVERTNVRLRTFIYGLMFFTLILPTILKAIAWVMLLDPRVGMLNLLWYGLGFSEPLFDAYSMPAMWLVEGLSMTPLAFLLLGATLRGMDPALEEAAYTSGANKVLTLYRVTFKVMIPAISAAALLLFVRAIEAVDVPLIMGAREGIMVYATQIYYASKVYMPPNFGQAFVLTLFLIFLSVIGLVLYQRVLRRSERYVTVTGKGYRPRLIDLGRWRPLATGFLVFYAFTAIALPFLMLLWVSFLPFIEAPSREALSRLTLANYQNLLKFPTFLTAVRNTAVLATSVAVVGVLLAVLVSWIVIRLKPRGASVLDAAAFLPYAIPGIAVGFSFMMIFLAFPNPVYGTIWIMALAYVVNFLPIATRFTHSGLAQIHRELEDAAATSGASFVNVFRRILIPLLLPSLVAGGLYIFMLTVRVFSMAAILVTPDSTVLAYLIFELWHYGSTPMVGALAVIMALFLAGVTLVSRRLTERRTIMT